MRAARSIHLLIAAAILFSQIVSGVHMAGHAHLPAALAASGAVPAFSSATTYSHSSVRATASATASATAPATADGSAMHVAHPEQLTASEHEALHQQAFDLSGSPELAKGKAYLDRSCVIYHIYAGSHCVAAITGVVSRSVLVASHQPTIESLALPVQRTEHNAIRGPPALS